MDAKICDRSERWLQCRMRGIRGWGLIIILTCARIADFGFYMNYTRRRNGRRKNENQI